MQVGDVSILPAEPPSVKCTTSPSAPNRGDIHARRSVAGVMLVHGDVKCGALAFIRDGRFDTRRDNIRSIQR